jgi:hypothetical protein
MKFSEKDIVIVVRTVYNVINIEILLYGRNGKDSFQKYCVIYLTYGRLLEKTCDVSRFMIQVCFAFWRDKSGFLFLDCGLKKKEEIAWIGQF